MNHLIKYHHKNMFIIITEVHSAHCMNELHVFVNKLIDHFKTSVMLLFY